MNCIDRRLLPFLLLASATCAFAAEPVTGMLNTKSASPAQQLQVAKVFGKLPLSFEPNQGQTDPQVRFVSRGDGYSLSLTPSEAVLSLQGRNCRHAAEVHAGDHQPPCVVSPNAVLRMSLRGSNPKPQIAGQDELAGKSNYFIGQNDSAWRTNISNYRKVLYSSVYPGIDLVYYGNQRQLEHDFIVAPGADPAAIRLTFSGARRLSVTRDGDLELLTANGVTELKRPVIYQEVAGLRHEVTGQYIKKNGSEIGFAVGSYDRSQPLVIDPVLVYSTYFGGSVSTQPNAIAVDGEGNAYITGIADPTGFPLANALFNTPPNPPATVGFVSKISADGSTLLYSTFLGGPDAAASCSGIAVDDQGNAYVTGYTFSTAFPVVNAFQPRQAGEGDAFVTKLNATGSALEYSTYLGGSHADFASGIAVDKTGAAYVTGNTYSKTFPARNALSVIGHVFITKFTPEGALQYSTRLGTSSTVFFEQASAVAVDLLGEAIVTGYTSAAKFPLKNALYSTLDAAFGQRTVFVTKLNADASGLVFSTFFGGGEANAIATNASGDAFITGVARSANRFGNAQSLFPTSTLPNTFVTRFKADGSALVYSTYLGNTGAAQGVAIAADEAGNAYVTGGSDLTLPVKDPIQQPGGNGDAFLTKLDPAGSSLVYSTFLGGGMSDKGNALAIDGKGNVFIAGQTISLDFPVKNALRPTPSDGIVLSHAHYDGFVTRISDVSNRFSITDTVDKAVVAPGGDLNYTITVTNNGPGAAAGIVSVTSIRDRFQTCQTNNGDACKFVPFGGRATVNLSPLAQGESRTISIYATAAKTAGEYNMIPNTATVSTLPPLYDSATASASSTVRETADLGITSSLTDSTNGLLHYVLNVTNPGPDNSHAALVLDSVPAHADFVSASSTFGACSFHPTIGRYGSVRCTVGNLAAGNTAKIDVILQAFKPSCPSVTSTATVTSQSIDTNSANDSVTVSAPLPQSVCSPTPPPSPKYKVSLFDDTDVRSGAAYLNNNGDLAGGTSTGAFIYKNGATSPTLIPLTFYLAGLNDLGEVVGEGFIDGSSKYGVYKNGGFHEIDFGTQFPFPYIVAFNNSGDITGYEEDDSDSAAGFIRKDGVTELLGDPSSGHYTYPTSMNSKGEVAGSSYYGGFIPTHAFLSSLGPTVSLTPDYAVSSAAGVDSSGRVVGSLMTKGSKQSHVFVYSSGKVRDLGPGTGVSTYPSAINDCGEIVGNNASGHGAFLYTHGGFLALDQLIKLPKGVFLQPTAINNRGQILGTAFDSSTNKSDTVLLTPDVLEKCGLDAAIDNTPDAASLAVGGTITYTIKAKNLDTATTAFTVTDELAPNTEFLACSVTGGGGSCQFSSATNSVSVALPNLEKGSTATIVVQVKTTSAATNLGTLNTAKLSSALTTDYLSTAYTYVY